MTATAFVEVGELRLRVSVELAGGGTPLLLCNGLGAGLELWEPFRRALPATTATVAFDAPGAGRSATPAYPPTLRGIADVSAGMLVALGLGRVDVLGVSWGGMLAQELARRHAARVRRLVLAATTAGWLAYPGDPRAMALLATPVRYRSAASPRRMASRLYGGEFRSDPEAVGRYPWLRHVRPSSHRGYLWQLMAARRWTSVGWLGRLTPPTLVLAGDSDPLVPLANARMLSSRIPHATLHVVGGGGHLFLLTRARELAPVLAGFLGWDTAVGDDDDDEQASALP
ncbi:MAG: alpha/beta fold hydrolase [Acidimicrobiia bacterium]